MCRRLFTLVFFVLAEKIQKRDILSKYFVLKSEASEPFPQRKKRATELLLSQILEASLHVPYYRDLFSSLKISYEKIKNNIQYFSEIPYLTKDIIREQGQRMLNEKYKLNALYQRKTGGSTGPSTLIYYDKDSLDWTAAQNIVMLQWGGKKLGEREIHISTRFMEKPTPEGIRLEKRKCFVLNRINILTDNHSPSNMDKLWKDIRSAHAKSIQGCPSTMYALANHIKGKGISVGMPFEIFISTGEMLPEAKRQFIQKNLHCRVSNRYGAAEFGVIAQERHDAPANGLLVSDSLVWPEQYGNSLDGIGELVITSLRNKAMPLLRYRMGDIGQLEENRKGWWIHKLWGRVHDEVYIGDKLFPTHYILDVLDHRCPGILDFQIAVHNGHAKELRLVAEAAEWNDIEQALASQFPNLPLKRIGMHELQFVGWRGKFRYVIEV